FPRTPIFFLSGCRRLPARRDAQLMAGSGGTLSPRWWGLGRQSLPRNTRRKP
ncbi:hypothetical protein HMPREF0731_2315, partial [Pseudoroseomonas cervicalis ATCC 49957]